MTQGPTTSDPTLDLSARTVAELLPNAPRGRLSALAASIAKVNQQQRQPWGSIIVDALVSAVLVLPRLALKFSALEIKPETVNDEEVFLKGQRILVCAACLTHISSHDDVVSRCFHGRDGRAFLMSKAVNVRCAVAQDRQLMTGLHRVCDIHCRNCNTVLGWKYEHAYEESQQYKIGKFVLEKHRLMEM